jgi:hypothetical protein
VRKIESSFLARRGACDTNATVKERGRGRLTSLANTLKAFHQEKGYIRGEREK